MTRRPFPSPDRRGTTNRPRKPLRTRAQANARARAKTQAAFLAKLVEVGTVLHAALAVKIGRRTVYASLERDEAFRRQYEEAVEDAVDTLEREAWRRATEGDDRPVYQGGRMVGSVRERSDRLLEVLLKGRRGDVFKDRAEVTGKAGGPIQVSYDPAMAPDEGS